MGEISHCEHCASPIEQPETGRPKRYCNDSCRQMAYRKRRANREEETPDSIGNDDEIDLDALDRAGLRELAVRFGVSASGDRESLIQRIVNAADTEAREPKTVKIARLHRLARERKPARSHGGALARRRRRNIVSRVQSLHGSGRAW